MLCAVYTVHEETRSVDFLVEPQNQGLWFVSGLASKPLGQFLPVWPQNRWLRVSRFGPQNRQLRFGDLGLKITATVSWFGPQNQVGYGLSVAPQNRWEGDSVGQALRSSGLLRVEVSQASVFQLSSKLTKAQQRVVHMTASWRLRRVEAEDGWVDMMGYVRPCYPSFAIFLY
jgi:hypothetical protein